jgi:CHAT domain-containing protein/tetratricopeptide (TPR) repeat protein
LVAFLGLVTLLLAALPGPLAGKEPTSDQTSARDQLKRRASQLNQQAYALYRQGRHAAATKLLREALKLREQLYPKAKYPDGHPDLAASLDNLGGILWDQGDYDGALPFFQKTLAMVERLYPKAKYPGGHPEVALSLNKLGGLLYKRGDYDGALPYLTKSQAMYERLYPPDKYPQGHPDLAFSLINLAFVYQKRRDFTQALAYYQKSLAMRERLYPPDKYADGHPDLAISLHSLGSVLNDQGDYDGALGYYRRALAMRQRLYPPVKYPRGHPALGASLAHLGAVLQERGDYVGALAYSRRALEMRERLCPKDKYPRGDPQLAAGLANVGLVLWARGDYTSALDYSRRALQMRERLYPKDEYPEGHPALANSLNNLSLLLISCEDYAGALAYCRRGLEMRERLYSKAKFPRGHPLLVLSLDNLAWILHARKDHVGAVAYGRQALEMGGRLYPEDKYPRGHPHLADTLNNLSSLLWAQGDYTSALDYCRRALRMRERLYPKDRYPQGHPLLAKGLTNLGSLLHFKGNYAGAFRYLRRALAMNQNLADLFAEAASEAQALTFVASLPQTRDCLLSTTDHLTGIDADAYRAVWRTKAAVTRCLERRHRDLARALASEQMPAAHRQEIERLGTKLLDTRRALARLLLSPPADPEAHRRRARLLSQNKEELEGQLARLLPAFARRRELERQEFAALAEKLPPATAFIDLVRYVHFEPDAQRPGKKGWSATPSYAAFVLRRGGPVRRVKLGPAARIDQALTAWRAAIGNQKTGPAAQTLRRLLWQPLARHVPSGTRAVLLAPDGALTRLPWAALPVSADGRVLLEDCAVAVVPHGPFLLERLSEPARATQETGRILAVGAVSYDGKPRAAQRTEDLAFARAAEWGDRSLTWPKLTGTAAELGKVLGSAGTRQVCRLSGVEATTTRLLAELPQARWAHIATHGFFADGRVRSALHLDEDLFKSHGFEGGPPPGARSPLVLSGLVLAGANLPLSKDLEARLADDHGILTAEAIAGLPLYRLELAVLSACETGLGEVAGGEGVFGLQRAFHLAGAKNVIASLWKVDDQATAALMALFYDKLWRQKMPASEALRQAQLTLYFHPERIGALARERGPNFDKVVKLPAGPDKGGKARPGNKTPVKLWAGFVLSGLGR